MPADIPGTGGPPPLLHARAALYLDFDGTLAAIAERPEQVVVRHPLPEVLEALRRELGGAVAVVTGRPLADIDRLLVPLQLPGAGLHGSEFRPAAGTIRRLRSPAGLPELVTALRGHFARDQRVLVEDKGVGVAVHYRQAPERAQECLEILRRLSGAVAVEIISGSMVVEARRPDVDKGAALGMLAAEAPFAGRQPVFVGDDFSDEDGFRAASRLGGHGIKVGDGPTCAQYRCATVQDVYAWLDASVDALAAADPA